MDITTEEGGEVSGRTCWGVRKTSTNNLSRSGHDTVTSSVSVSKSLLNSGDGLDEKNEVGPYRRNPLAVNGSRGIHILCHRFRCP